MSEYKFNVDAPHKTYDVSGGLVHLTNHHLIFMQMYENDILEDEIKDLQSHKKYARIMCFQDTPTSDPYIKCYCRDVSEMIPSHREEAENYFKDANEFYPEDKLILVEINYSTLGYFFLYKL